MDRHLWEYSQKTVGFAALEVAGPIETRT